MEPKRQSRNDEQLTWWRRYIADINAPPRLRFRQFRYWLSPKLVRLGTRTRVIPWGLTYDDELTTSGRRYAQRLGAALLALAAGAFGLLLLSDTSWKEVLAGALLAWSPSLVVWAWSSYKRGKAELRSELNRVTEVDLLHARLNRIDYALGIAPIDLDSDLQLVIDARTERLAHYSGIEESPLAARLIWVPILG